MCWKYFYEFFMDTVLLPISLTKFNKLSKRRKHNFLITEFTFALYWASIFTTFSVYLSRAVFSTPVYLPFMAYYTELQQKGHS